MRGSAVTEDIRRKFAQKFLETGSIRLACKFADDLPIRTGYDVADELEEDPEFTKARKRLYDNALARAEAAVMRAIDVSAERVEREPVVGSAGGDDGKTIVIDNGHNYAKATADLYKALLLRRKNDFDMSPDKPQSGPLEVVIRRAGDKPEGDAAG